MKNELNKYGFIVREDRVKEFDKKYSFETIQPIGDLLKFHNNLISKENNRLYYYENNNLDLFNDKLKKIYERISQIDNKLIYTKVINYLETLKNNKNILKTSDIDCISNIDLLNFKGKEYIENNVNKLFFEKDRFNKIFDSLNESKKSDIINSEYFKYLPIKEKVYILSEKLGLTNTESKKLVEMNYF